ncbi:unnamed protein product [Sphagnum jensenii]|uniref:Uncharacterized protein n=1 Tax=Sphagnum jensenii TaxID=128206 RepID=A0ABP1C012_9BRYO
MKHGKDYLNNNQSNEQDCNKIGNEVGLFVKAYRECIEVLKNSIGIEEKQAHGACQLASSIGKRFSKHRLYFPISMAVEAANNKQNGNKELNKTQKCNSSSQPYTNHTNLLYSLIITLFFLDWYNG